MVASSDSDDDMLGVDAEGQAVQDRAGGRTKTTVPKHPKRPGNTPKVKKAAKTKKTMATAKPGHKICGECEEEKPDTEFRPGACVCTNPCMRMRENFNRACLKEGCVDWLTEQRKNPSSWKKLKRWYNKQMPKGGKKVPPVKIMQYFQKIRTEQQALRDGVHEMMHLCAFAHFAKKAKELPSARPH